MKLILFIKLVSWLTVVAGYPPQSIVWTRDLIVGSEYHIRWSNEDPEYLVMEMQAPIRGYLSIGFSPNGGMAGSDIVMGWVDDSGKGHLKDLFAIGNSAPLEDVHSDYELLFAEENEFGTTIRFRRKWDTCDVKNDKSITEDTVRLIWAVSDEDPMRNDKFIPSYHKVDFRGGHSVYLKFQTHLSPFPDDLPVPDPNVHHWDVRFDNVLVDGITDTTYHCKIFKAPEFQDMSIKHQIIGYRSLIDPSNRQWVHHINFFECSVPPHFDGSQNVFEQYLDHPGAPCYTKNMPPEWSQFCISVPFAWAAGAEGLMLPDHGGIPLHEEHNGTTYFMMEIHYDNPKKLQLTDNSGVRVFITGNTRKYDYSSITIHARFGQLQMIPPKATGWRNMGFCTSECTKSIFPPEGITVTHAMLHAHLTAKKLIIRHIRGDQELSPIAQDLHYDFNYQQTRVLNPPRKVLPGDVVLIECEYDTTDRTNITYGGTSTRDEMCQGVITYYPKVPLAVCKTQHEFHNFFDALGIHKVGGEQVLDMLHLPYIPKQGQLFDVGDDAYILKNGINGQPQYPFDVLYVTDPEPPSGSQTVREYVDKIDWIKSNGELINKVWKQWWEGDHVNFCTGPGFTRIPLKNYLLKYPNFVPHQQPVSENCLQSNTGRLVLSTHVLLFNLFLVKYVFAFKSF